MGARIRRETCQLEFMRQRIELTDMEVLPIEKWGMPLLDQRLSQIFFVCCLCLGSALFLGRYRIKNTDQTTFCGLNSFYIILESSCQSLIQRALGELPIFQVMTWQQCYILRSTLNCFQVTRLNTNVRKILEAITQKEKKASTLL